MIHAVCRAAVIVAAIGLTAARAEPANPPAAPAGVTHAIESDTPAAPDPTVVEAWFNHLSEPDQQKFLDAAKEEGLITAQGRPFSAHQFSSMAAFMDAELSRQGLSAADKREVLQQFAERAGIDIAANPPATAEFGGQD